MRFPCVFEVVFGDGTTAYDADFFLLFDEVCNDIDGGFEFFAPGERLYGICRNVCIKSVDNGLVRLRVGRVREVMICRRKNVVVGEFFEKGWLGQEPVIANRCNEKIVVCGLGGCPAFTCQLFLEADSVCAVKGDTIAVTGKLPIRFRGDLFLEGIKEFLDGKSPVFPEIRGNGELDAFVECRECNIFDGGACRNGDGVVFCVVCKRDEDGGREALFAPLDKARCHIQILVAKVFGFGLEDLAEFV